MIPEFLSFEDVLEMHDMQLARYGISIEDGSPLLYDITMAVAEGRADKADVAMTFSRLARSS